MKKYDWLIAAAVIIIALLWLGIQNLVLNENGTEITVTSGGNVTAAYSLLEDNTITFTDEKGGRNVLVIREGRAVMSEADCPDKLCTRQKAISKKGGSIICLPHKLAIEVTKGEESGLDAVVQ